MKYRHSSDDTTIPYTPPNYIIRKRVRVGDYFVLKVWYRDATNMNGNKILVYKDSYGPDLDPHFREEGGPVARFFPSQDGWENAIRFAQSCN